jgi:hypothetical protein
MAITTQDAVLKYKATVEGTFTEVEIKSFPDMGAAPNLIEVTTLSDTAQQFIEGVKPMAAIEFTANYDETVYEALAAVAGDALIYQLEFGTNGTFGWTGSHTVIVAGGGVNAVLDMKLSVLPDSIISKVA